ncbi:MAG: malonic semialdehyde reductase [Rhodospirillales bacterium]
MSDPVEAAKAAVLDVRSRVQRLDENGLDLIFREARSHNGWLDKPVDDAMLRTLYEVVKWGPTSSCSSPARFIFVRTPEGKEKLRPSLSKANVDKTLTAPVVAIVATEFAFHDSVLRLYESEMMYNILKNNKEASDDTAIRNANLQGAYLIIAARALGLDCGAMSGFDKAKVDEAFFAGTTLKTNFLCALGYGDAGKVKKKWGRMSFDEACTLA